MKMSITNFLRKRDKNEPTTHKDFEPIKNPYIVGNPIKSTEMFFGRKDEFKNIEDWIVNDGPLWFCWLPAVVQVKPPFFENFCYK
jgi:hypothetical protein